MDDVIDPATEHGDEHVINVTDTAAEVDVLICVPRVSWHAGLLDRRTGF